MAESNQQEVNYLGEVGEIMKAKVHAARVQPARGPEVSEDAQRFFMFSSSRLKSVPSTLAVLALLGWVWLGSTPLRAQCDNSA